MPVTGRKPKPDGQRVTRHALTQEWVDVPEVPYGGERPEMKIRTAATRDWWARISTMPHCVLWAESDWQFALDTARVHALFARKGIGAGELRMRERVMGTTVDARRDLRIRYVRPEEPAAADGPAPVTDFEAERRRRLLDAD